MEFHSWYKGSGILHEVNPYHVTNHLHLLIDGSALELFLPFRLETPNRTFWLLKL